MPSYFDGEAIKQAVGRLQESRAKPSLCDFLILKRALVRGDASLVTLSSVDPHLRGAALDMTLALPSGYDGPAQAKEPYFNPFGTAHEARGGWRTQKYISNGTSDTVTGPGWRDITEQVPDAKPRQVVLKTGYESAIESVLLKKDGELPKITDATVWFFRFQDLDEAVGAKAGQDEDVVEAFVEMVGLTGDERLKLFTQ